MYIFLNFSKQDLKFEFNKCFNISKIIKLYSSRAIQDRPKQYITIIIILTDKD